MTTSQSVSRMWSGLQSKHSHGKGRSALMISCEAELQELMRELDAMVQKKESQWEDRYNLLQTDLDMKSNELRIAQDTLELRNKEISQLRYSIQNIDKENANKLSKYEGEVTELRKQLINLKKCYEKLQRKHKRDYTKLEQNNSQSETALHDSMAEVQRLNDKVEEYKSKTRDWNSERTSYLSQISNLEAQRKTLAEKCELIKHQSHIYKTQLDNRRDLLDSTEMTLRGQVTQLEGQIQRDKDTMNYQEEKIKQLKKQLQECESSLRQTRCIKDRIHEELEEVSANQGRVEDETTSLSREVKYYRECFRTSKQRSDEMEKQMVELKQKLREKSTQLNKIDEVNALQESEQVRKLLTDLQNVQMNNFSLQEQQKSLQTDVDRLTEQVARSEGEVCRLSELLRKKNEERNCDARDARQYEAEVCRLRAKIESMEDSHDSQLEGMKVQMTNLTEELHQRNTAFSNVTDKLAHTEFQYKQEVIKHQKDISDFELTKAQLDALRHENKHLKQAVISQQETANDVSKFENMLRKLEGEYNHAVEKLQMENRKLREDLDNMRMERSSGSKKSDRSTSGNKRKHRNNNAVGYDWQSTEPVNYDLRDRQLVNANSSALSTDTGSGRLSAGTPSQWVNQPGTTTATSPAGTPPGASWEHRPVASPKYSSQYNTNNNNSNDVALYHEAGTSPMSVRTDVMSSPHHSIPSVLDEAPDSEPGGNGVSLTSSQRLISAQDQITNLSSSSEMSRSHHSTSVLSSGNISNHQVAPPSRDSLDSWQLNSYSARPSSRASISGQFLAEEQQRSDNLRRNIDILIEDFEKNNTSKFLSDN